MLSQDKGALAQANGLGCHDLIGRLVLQEAILMDAGFMGKGISPHNGLVGLDPDASDR